MARKKPVKSEAEPIEGLKHVKAARLDRTGDEALHWRARQAVGEIARYVTAREEENRETRKRLGKLPKMRTPLGRPSLQG